ncbi:hypothetical protein AMATHDRAFT_146753 [Amanita thiersii Skay4041]|uniref:FAD/NAD(P)-binding domain-containing protein n=1 Tax=Amanita thiersii Skay4041 TaxID=703135 RepID=A0A2A9NFL7_9AGAR|nr:hypothetical protein AMATHDRAFT_146753 [Amanita thiersii Skay4041]
MSKKNDDKRHIVIVGAGGGGTAVARSLSAKLDPSNYRITMINPRSHYVALPATIRMAVYDVDKIDERAFVPLDRVFLNGNGTLLQDKVKAIEKNKENGGRVLLESGEYVDFDVLVLSPGSIWGGPIAFPEGEQETKEFIKTGRDAFKGAQDIVIAGGGAIGIELAGEIKDAWPTKNVTIVHGNGALLNKSYPDKFRKRAEQRVRAHDVHLVLDDFVDTFEPTNGIIKTRKGVELRADLVVSARGPRPNTAFIGSSLGADVLSDGGFVKILPTFQLPNYLEIFAIGDIIDWPEQKQLLKAVQHAAIVTSNIQAYMSDHGTKLKQYKGQSETIVITVGKNGGVSYIGILWGIIVGDWLTRLVKSKNVLVNELRGGVGY